MDFAENLKRLREEKGLSQSDLAQKVGVGRSTICSYESGRRTKLTVPTIRAIAEVLNVTPNDLFDSTNSDSKDLDVMQKVLFNSSNSELTIYDRIDMILKERRISRRKLARKIGIPESTLASAFTRRPEHFPEKYIQAIAEALKVSWEVLVAGADSLHSNMLKSGTIVRHFKGKLYQVVGIAVHTETAEEMVIYQALYPPFITYARPKDMFMSKVDEEKYPEHAGEWRLRMATPEEIRGQEEKPNGKADSV